MTDADLIYNALLRAERKLEARAADEVTSPEVAKLNLAAFAALRTLREEIGNGLTGEGR